MPETGIRRRPPAAPTLPIRLSLALLLAPCLLRAMEPVPKDFKVAFFGDQGITSDSKDVLKLVKAEGTRLIVQLGDFDYEDDPAAWEKQTDDIMGPGFPQLAVMGNHDELKWAGTGGYGARIKTRMDNMGVKYAGEPGKKCAFNYQGLFFVSATPGLEGTGHDAFIRKQLAQDSSMWRITFWHYNMTNLQLGTKPDRTGWEVYEEARMGGAIIATAHDHQYGRTHLLSSMKTQTVVAEDTLLKVTKGRSFVFVSGLAGQGMYEKDDPADGKWWASTYSSDTYGVLFGVFNAGGQQNRASFYFKNVDGKIIDRFEVISEVNQPPVSLRVGRDRIAVDPRSWEGSMAAGLQVADLTGRRMPTGSRAGNAAGLVVRPERSGVYFVHAPGTGKQPRKIAVLD